jgi:CheY-like chemotaxis protein
MASSVQPPRPVVLVVEDDALLRYHAADIVEDAGYEAIAVENADEAIRLLETRKDIRLIFTDIDMPGSMDGLKLAAVVRDRWPPVEIIVTSGVRSVADADLPARSLFFAKPYSADLVTAAIRNFVGPAA